MLRLFVAGAAAATLAVAPGALVDTANADGFGHEPGSREIAGPQLRLAVSDGTVGRVSIVNLAQRRVIGRFGLRAPARLYSAGDGRHALATQSSAHRVDVIDAGSWSVPHGDHSHHYIRAPRLRSPLLGRTPIHTVAHDGRVAIFNDGTGVAILQPSARIQRGPVGARRVRSGAPHHGVAVPVGPRTLISVAPQPGARPDSVALAGPNGRIIARVGACPGLHGEAPVGPATIMFACANGYLAVTVRGARATARVLPAVRRGTEVLRSGTLSSAEGLPFAIGNLGSQGLVRVHPQRGPLNVIDLGADRGHFVLDGESRSILTVTTDGRLHQVNPVNGRIVRSVRVAAPFSLSGGHAVPRPQITLGPERRAYISDPERGRVVEVATNPLRVTRAIRVGGSPTSLVVLGTEHDHD